MFGRGERLLRAKCPPSIDIVPLNVNPSIVVGRPGRRSVRLMREKVNSGAHSTHPT